MRINKDQVVGRAKQVDGRIKEFVGELLGSRELQLDGTIEKAGGLRQKARGELKAVRKNRTRMDRPSES